MEPTSLFCACLLLAQTPAGSNGGAALPAQRSESAERPTVSALRREKTEPVREAGPLESVQHADRKVSPVRLLERLAKPPETQPLSGEPLPLLDVVTRTPAAPRRLEAVRAYWALATSVMNYHVCRLEAVELLRQAQNLREREPGAETAQTEAALAETQAEARQARLDVAEKQARLVEMVGLPNDRPLPSDRPHPGGYRSEFETLFANRPAPARLRFIDRMFPSWQAALEARASAAQAARDCAGGRGRSIPAGRRAVALRAATLSPGSGATPGVFGSGAAL